MDKILIIEDDIDIMTILKIYLKKEFYEIWEVGNGAETME